METKHKTMYEHESMTTQSRAKPSDFFQDLKLDLAGCWCGVPQSSYRILHCNELVGDWFVSAFRVLLSVDAAGLAERTCSNFIRVPSWFLQRRRVGARDRRNWSSRSLSSAARARATVHEFVVNASTALKVHLFSTFAAHV